MSANTLPPNWSWVKLGDVCEILDNKRSPINSDERDKRISGKSIESLFPYYGATGQVGYIDDYLLEGEFVLLGEDGAPFLEKNKPKAYIVNGKIWVNNHAHVLLSRNHNKFLCYYLNFLDYRPFVTGTTRLKLNQSSMKQIPIINPPLPEQKKIVEKIEELFSGLDSGVASLKKAKEQIRLYRQSVLSAAFSGKLTQKARGQKQERLNGIQEVSKAAEQKVEYSNQLPEGWRWVKLGEVLEVKDGTHDTPKYHDKGIPFITQKNIKNGEFVFDNYRLISEEDHQKFYKRSNVAFNDIIISMIGANRGMSTIVKIKETFSIKNVGLVKTDESKFLAKYLAYFFKSEIGQSSILSQSKGGAQQFIGLTELRNWSVPFQPLNRQTQIVEEIEKRFSEADNLEKVIDESLTKSETLRQSILKQAFEGKLV